MSESAVSAKRGWVQFGAKSAQSETPAPSRGQAASTRKRTQWNEDGVALPHATAPPVTPFIYYFLRIVVNFRPAPNARSLDRGEAARVS